MDKSLIYDLMFVKKFGISKKIHFSPRRLILIFKRSKISPI